MAVLISESFEQDYSRSPELLVPDRFVQSALGFTVVMDTFMDEAIHRLIDYGRHQGARLDRYEEMGDMVYSIIHPAIGLRRMPQGTRIATSIVRGADERFYGDWHYFKTVTNPEGTLTHERSANNSYPLSLNDWHEHICPVTKALTTGRALLKVY